LLAGIKLLRVGKKLPLLKIGIALPIPAIQKVFGSL
jgi:hypothetical protein